MLAELVRRAIDAVAGRQGRGEHDAELERRAAAVDQVLGKMSGVVGQKLGRNSSATGLRASSVA